MRRTKRTSPSDGIELDDEFRPLTCPNCGTERKGEYCHGCGQRFLKDRLTAWELWWLFADRFLDWEEGVWRTFLQMARSPGVVIRDYLGGKRKTYLNPFSYLLFCTALYALGQFIMRRVAGLTTIPGFQQLQEMGMALDDAEDQFSVIAYGTVVVVAVLALTMQLMFDRRLLNVMEAVVTAIYASGNVVMLALGISLVEFVLTGDPLQFSGLIVSFVLLFPLCMAHIGLGLFESWGMAGYMGVAPVAAGLMAGIVFALFGGIVSSGVSLTGGLAGISFVLAGPALVFGLFMLLELVS